MVIKGREDTPLVELSAEETAEITEKLRERPLPLKLPKGRLSVTQAEMYLRCGRQYMFRYVRDELRPPGIAMALGRGTHKAAELTHHHIVDHGTPANDEEVLDAFSDEFSESLTDVTDRSTEGPLKDTGATLVRLYNTHHAPTVKPQVAKDGTRGIEKRFDTEIAGVPMLGFIDLIDTNVPSGVSEIEYKMLQRRGVEVPEHMRLCITDLKTKARSASQADTDNALQLSVYSLVEQIPTVRYDQLIKTKVPKVKRITSHRTRADHLWVQELISSVANAISAGVFPPCDPATWVCSAKWCGYWDQCRGRKV